MILLLWRSQHRVMQSAQAHRPRLSPEMHTRIPRIRALRPCSPTIRGLTGNVHAPFSALATRNQPRRIFRWSRLSYWHVYFWIKASCQAGRFWFFRFSPDRGQAGLLFSCCQPTFRVFFLPACLSTAFTPSRATVLPPTAPTSGPRRPATSIRRRASRPRSVGRRAGAAPRGQGASPPVSAVAR